MSYQFPTLNQVDFSWGSQQPYDYPQPNSTDFTWLNYACDYINYVPASPNVNFALDKPSDYIPPSNNELSFVNGDYVTPASVGFTYSSSYTVPLGNNTNFYLICDVSAFDIVFVQGSSIFEQITSAGEMYHWDDPWVITGYTDIGEIAVDSEIAVSIVAFGDVTLGSISSTSIIDRGNVVRSNARLNGNISSVGKLELVPIVTESQNNIGEITSEGIGVVGVIEVGGNLHFSDGISHLKGRVIFGYPKAPVIRQAYELSTNRSLTIPYVPEDPDYAVFINTTDFNITNEELKRGTVDMTFTFDHDIKDIKRISVWVMNSDGHAFRDKMQIIDYPGGLQKDHILFDPFKNTTSFAVPIHCISKKENQFYIEIEYNNDGGSSEFQRDRYMKEFDKHIIPFQAQFDNRNPYANIADSNTYNGPDFSQNSLFIQEYDENGPQYIPVNNDVTSNVSQAANNNSFYDSEYSEQARIFYIPDDDVTEHISQGANNNTYFIQEYDDLSSGQIGG